MSCKVVPPPLPAWVRPPRRRGLVCWPAVGSALAVAVLLVTGVVAWAVSHPPARPQQQASASAARTAREVKPRARVKRSLPVAAAAPARPVLEPAPTRPVADLTPLPLAAPARKTPAAETYGTRIRFLANPTLAAGQARREGKLLFLLHLSGNLEEACFT